MSDRERKAANRAEREKHFKDFEKSNKAATAVLSGGKDEMARSQQFMDESDTRREETKQRTADRG